jgi:hypothetical protein
MAQKVIEMPPILESRDCSEKLPHTKEPHKLKRAKWNCMDGGFLPAMRRPISRVPPNGKNGYSSVKFILARSVVGGVVGVNAAVVQKVLDHDLPDTVKRRV